MDILKMAGLVILCAFILLIVCWVVGIAVLAFLISMIPKLMFWIAAVGVGLAIIVGAWFGLSRVVKS